MNPIQASHALGHSIWLDFIRREMIVSGRLQRSIDEDGIRGLTSNPAIFQKAIAASTDYDAALAALIAQGHDTPQALFEQLAIEDMRMAADAFYALYRDSQGADGYVSLEVSPHLAMDAHGTVQEGRRLWHAVNRPNLMIKVPGTVPGMEAIEQLIAEGINVNVTLLFSRTMYRETAQAYQAGLERLVAAGGDPASVASVASFFVSRIDTQMDALIDRLCIADEAITADITTLVDLRGQVAIANARMACADFLEIIATPRWQALAAKGSRPQRLLWASTATKNPAYSDLHYVETLIGAHTVNTIPPATLDAFLKHGKVETESLVAGIEESRAVLAAVEHLQLPLEEITTRLLAEGLRQFETAYDQLMAAVAGKRDVLMHAGYDAPV